MSKPSDVLWGLMEPLGLAQNQRNSALQGGSYNENFSVAQHEDYMQRALMQKAAVTQAAGVSRNHTADTVVAAGDVRDAPTALDMSLADLTMLWRQRFGDQQWVAAGTARVDSFWRVLTARLVNAHLLERLEVHDWHPDHTRLYRLRGDDGNS